MAKISASFHCMICKQKLNFPDNLDIVEFMILILQFYKVHGLCESVQSIEKKEIKQKGRRGKR